MENLTTCHHCKDGILIDKRIGYDLNNGGLPTCESCNTSLNKWQNNKDFVDKTPLTHKEEITRCSTQEYVLKMDLK